MDQEPTDDLEFENPGDEAAYALLPGYALGIATDDERQQVEALLARYPQLAAEVSDYRALTERMLVETPPLEPPARAWDAIASQLTITPAQAAARGPGARIREILLAPRLRLSPVLVAAVLAVVVGIVGLLAGEIVHLRDTQARLLLERDQSETALALMRARDVGWVRMNNPAEPDASPSFAWLVYSPDDQAGVVLASGFPALQSGMAYQLWASGDEGRVSLGLFEVGMDGSGAMTFRLPDDISQFNSMGITTEPVGGSPGPTSPAVVRLDLQEFVERLGRRS